MPDLFFKCSGCGKHLVIDEEGVGLTINCNHCQQSNPVPAPAVGFQCGHCHQPLKAAEELRGETVHCSGCQGGVAVPGARPAPPAQTQVRRCPACGVAVATEAIACDFCQALLPVEPAPPAPKPKIILRRPQSPGLRLRAPAPAPLPWTNLETGKKVVASTVQQRAHQPLTPPIPVLPSPEISPSKQLPDWLVFLAGWGGLLVVLAILAIVGVIPDFERMAGLAVLPIFGVVSLLVARSMFQSLKAMPALGCIYGPVGYLVPGVAYLLGWITVCLPMLLCERVAQAFGFEIRRTQFGQLLVKDD